MTYSVRALEVAHFDAPGPEVFWMSEWDSWVPLAVNVVLVRSAGVIALVNTGPPEDLTELNAMWRTSVGEKCQLVVDDGARLEQQLALLGVNPEDVTHVILTPFQLYTIGGLHLFSNAEVCVSKTGWVHYHTTHNHPHDSRWHSIPRETLVHLVTDGWDHVRLLEDEDEIAPGLRTWWTGTHHRASMAVEIDTDNGTVVSSDAFFVYDNVEKNRPLGISENLYEGIAAYARANEVADHLIPLYDPAVLERYPHGVVSGDTRA